MEKGLNIHSLFQSLQPELNKLDEERITTSRAVRKVSLIWLPLVVIAVVGAIFASTQDETWIFYLLLIGAIVLYATWSVKKGNITKVFANSFKVKLIDKIIKKIDSSFVYEPENIAHNYRRQNAVVNHLQKINLLPTFHDCWREDVISGNIRENKFEFSEIKMDHGSGRNRRTVFTGILITVYLNHALPSPIYILPDSANRLRDSLWKMLSLKSKRGEIVVLNHEAFEKLFKVYAEDPQLPGTLLRTYVLDKLVMIHGKVSTMNPVKDSIRIAFVDNSITIAINLKTNLFEPRLHQPINDLTYFEGNVNYLILFLGLIDDLNLSR